MWMGSCAVVVCGVVCCMGGLICGMGEWSSTSAGGMRVVSWVCGLGWTVGFQMES